MKGIISILLLIILCLQIGGILFIYKAQQWSAQQIAQQALNDNGTEFQKITLTCHDYQKSKVDENEISYNGKMYDIKSLTVKDSLVELIVYNDIFEENILREIEEYIENIASDNKDFPYLLRQFLTMNYFSSFAGYVFLLFSAPIKFSYFKYLNVSFYASDIITPPPRLF